MRVVHPTSDCGVSPMKGWTRRKPRESGTVARTLVGYVGSLTKSWWVLGQT